MRIWPGFGVLKTLHERICRHTVGADTPAALAVFIGVLDIHFELSDPAELLDHLLALSDRYRHAVTRTAPSPEQRRHQNSVGGR